MKSKDWQSRHTWCANRLSILESYRDFGKLQRLLDTDAVWSSNKHFNWSIMVPLEPTLKSPVFKPFPQKVVNQKELHISEELCTLYRPEQRDSMASINQRFPNAIRLEIALTFLTRTHSHILPFLSISCFSISLSTLCLCFVRAGWQIAVPLKCEIQSDVSATRLGSDVNLMLAVTSTYITVSPV